MTQTRLGSLFESLTNVTLGYTVSFLSQLVIFPVFDIHVPLATNLWIGAWFTGVSLIRSYIVRRWFIRRFAVATKAKEQK